ncbi:FAD-binding and (Fe-S)-binding domain-containing protein [Nocardioides daeguensis]|uniref:FAD-binding and (Fe-S)-binding domain-containing protein n=1 Tax=Nocardioides daeguensis TaxID=908359 RepID=A0ABP6UZK7_9ACTN|nr:FAD-binding and (Fe-S)-binding domain-containing protein [Nocardioides daeguensis]MBV6728715.1 FAD-binding oxidoreductase [Nocardioides daeguensis]MCR1773675.1 FAD-binding oxidoreductase [Nocardioides daeguensis]
MSGIAQQLQRHGAGDVSDDAAVLGAYSSDASLYRVPPVAVAFPRSGDEVAAVLAAARAEGLTVTARGAGTSVAGNAIGPGVVIDFSRHLNQVLSVDAEAETAVVQPGVVQAVLQQAAAPHGLRFGPDPSTSTRCTIGGMIGNDACGARSLAYGRTSHNVRAVRALLADGSTLTTGYDADGTPVASAEGSDVLDRLRKVVAGDLATVRTEFGTFGRHVSGIALDHLAPERGFDLTRTLVGSEGTLAVLTEATVRLVRAPKVAVMVVLGFADFPTAGFATPEVLAFEPSACEGLDRRIVDVIRERRGENAVPPLPAGDAWMFVELSGTDPDDVRRRADLLAAAGLGISALVVDDPRTADRLWKIRADGAGLAGRAPSGKPAWAGWEDAAVPPDRLGTYLTSFEELLARHELTAMPFGHFGEGCLHVRMDFPFDRPDGAEAFRAFLEDAADLVTSLGGSLSGEHGDGRARSDLLPRMYSPAALSLMAAVKDVFDPTRMLNPGILVEPASSTADLRYTATARLTKQSGGLALAYTSDGGDFGQAVHRCTGVGKCRADNSGSGGVMCPSYQATKEEIHSTRGRARLLQEIVNGSSTTTWSSPEVHEALDLCLSCKGCASDCPTGTDMASYKAEVLHQTYKRKLRPRSHYSVGWLPRWAKVGSAMPRFANKSMDLAPLRKVALKAAGVDTRRRMPAFARRTFRRTFGGAAGTGTPVVLFVDSFTNHFAPRVADAAVAVLRDAGYDPRITRQQECCGLPWISTGQLDGAARRLGGMVEALKEDAHAGVPIVGLEPSCTAVLRHELRELVPGPDAAAVAGATTTLAELLSRTPAWTPPSLAGVRIVAQPHCHHHAVMGWSTDQALLERAGATVEAVPGCCGMAGNFGVEQGHYEVSVAVAEANLLPALRSSADDARRVVLADGFSCRTQLDELAPDAEPVHLAELLARGLR